MIKIAPSILSADFSKLGEEVIKLNDAGADFIHIDVMDGSFVPNLACGMKMIHGLKGVADLVFDVHLMVNEPVRFVKRMQEAGADVILISGYDGGTGASPKTSIQHAGIPWELGLAEAHQTLVMNDLRDRVRVETDGKLMTGRDVAIAALLGAEEFGFATAPLVSLGCVMMRVCNLDTCPVGIATQNKELRKRFSGKPEYVVNFMEFIAEELREYMAKLGFRSIDEMIGRVDKLKKKENLDNWKAKRVDLSLILNKSQVNSTNGVKFNKNKKFNHKLDEVKDSTILLKLAKPALENKENVKINIDIFNTDRTFGTILGSEITRRYKTEGLPEDTVWVKGKGTAGQSFGAFAHVLKRDIKRLKNVMDEMKVLNIGATAIGTAINVDPYYLANISYELSKVAGISLKQADDSSKTEWFIHHARKD